MIGSLNSCPNISSSEEKFWSSLGLEDARTAIAVERLEDDVAMLAAEGIEFIPVPRDQGGRHEIAVAQDEQLLRRVAHLGRVVDHEGLRVDRLQHVGGGDVAHVEGRVLAHEDHVLRGEVDRPACAERGVVALLVAHRHALARWHGASRRARPARSHDSGTACARAAALPASAQRWNRLQCRSP